ncbi:MAG: UDP-3-O-(3-hydroxymyristoyl)glucosamine N-acyltransferase [Epsilonproteobacteria bacterium]|nr:MAG: UDP-3-O-(3-hydroxymyristoyl)glucosamine N-acyltransferase [Campylobacterota bacterium]
MKLSQIAKDYDIKITNDINISGLNDLINAKETEITFLHDIKYKEQLKQTKASAVFVTKEFSNLCPKTSVPIVCENPYIAMAKTTKLFSKPLYKTTGAKPNIDKTTKLKENTALGFDTTIGKGSVIFDGVFIGDDVFIGNNCIIYPNVSIYSGTTIGDDCIIHAGTVIGSDGFGFANDGGKYIKIHHNGVVKIANDVEIGSNTSIDKAVFGATIIENGVRIDNLVHIAHNCHIGKGVIITGQCGFAGSSKLGDYVVIGAQSGVSGHLSIAPYTTISARSGVTKTIKNSHKQYTGFPIMEHKIWLKIQSKIQKLLPKDKR